MRNRALILTAVLINMFYSFALATPTIERVSLITCGPGKEIYELEGHTALRLTFDDGTDLSVNWGTFDFNSPNFLYRFVKGETDYRMSVYPFSYFLNQYTREGRWMNERVLNISNESKERLVALIDSTLTQGSPVYRYNYVLDNCATRPVDYIEAAVGSKVNLGDETGIEEPTGTFREDMTYYHKNYPWYQFGIDLALGSGIDRKIKHEEHKFAPIALDKMLEEATYDDKGEVIKLASPAVQILASGAGAPSGPTPFVLTPMFVCWLYCLLTFVVCVYDLTRHKVSIWYQSIYYFIATLAGFLLSFLIFISVHESTSPNWLYLWLNPLCVTGAVLIWLKNLKRAVYCWQIINFVGLIILAILALCGVQHLNRAFWPLILADALMSATWILIARWQKR